MHAPTQSPRSRPHGTPAYYLARPASVWITALHRQPRPDLTGRTAADPAGPVPAHLAAAG
jgi:hypothetical protein